MRLASAEYRSAWVWALCGIGVLIWAVFTVLFGGSVAHADSGSHGSPHSEVGHGAPGSSSHASSAAPNAPHGHKGPAQPNNQVKAQPNNHGKAQPKKTAPGAAQVAPQTPRLQSTTPPTPKASAVDRSSGRQTAPGQLRKAGSHAKDVADHLVKHGQDAVKHARAELARAAHAMHAELREHHANEDRGRAAHGPKASPARHGSPSAASHATKKVWHTTKNVAHTTAKVSAVPEPARAQTVISPTLPSTNAPESSRGLLVFGLQHQLSAPPDASSAGAGAASASGLLPGDEVPDAWLDQVRLATPRPADDLPPDAPVGSTDVSPD